MLKKFICFYFCFILIFTTAVSISAADVYTVSAKPVSVDIMLDGKYVKANAYNINGSNYFKLRDLAYILNGTKGQFDVRYLDGSMIALDMNKEYKAVGGENEANADKTIKKISQKNIVLTSMINKLSYQERFDAFNINGNNYFKLRDIDAFSRNIVVDYDKENSNILITTGAEPVSADYSYAQVNFDIDRYYNPSYIRLGINSEYGKIKTAWYTLYKMTPNKKTFHQGEIKDGLLTSIDIPKESGLYRIDIEALDSNKVELSGDRNGTGCFYYFSVYDKEELERLEKAADKFLYDEKLCNITDEMSTFEKVKAIYDNLRENCAYFDTANDLNYSDVTTVQNYTEYSALVNANTRCAGVAHASKLLFDKLGIECKLIYGDIYDTQKKEPGGHAWNIINVDGKYYHFDATSYQEMSNINYSGFLNSDNQFAEILKDYECKENNEFLPYYERVSWSKSKGYPKCEYSYDPNRLTIKVSYNKEKDTYSIQPVKNIDSVNSDIKEFLVVSVPKGKNKPVKYLAVVKWDKYYNDSSGKAKNQNYADLGKTSIPISGSAIDTDANDYYYYIRTENGIDSSTANNMWSEIKFSDIQL